MSVCKVDILCRFREFCVRGTRPSVAPPRVPDADLELVARAVETGRHQNKVAADLGWTTSRVKRCLQIIRTLVAKEHGVIWLDTSERSAVEVARQWLKMREDAHVPSE